MTLRCTSLVPPATVRHRVASIPWVHRCGAPLHGRPLGAEHGQAQLLDPLLVLGTQQLAQAGLGPGVGAGQRGQGGPVGHQRASDWASASSRPSRTGGPAS